MKRRLRNVTSIDTKDNDIDFRFDDAELFQIRNLSQPNVVGLLSHGDLTNGVTYIQGLAKIDRIVDSLTIDEQLTVKGIGGHHLNHFVLDLKTNEFKIKMNDGVETIQFSKLSDNVTTSIVSHGDTSNGIIDINGKLKVKGVEFAAFESSTTTTDNVTTELNTGVTNTATNAKLHLHVETASQDSFIEIDLIKQGSGYTAKMGRQTGTEFAQLSVAYNSTKSGQLGTHYIDIVGSGSGASMTFNVRTNSNFKR